MIICSCNVLSEATILAALEVECANRPRSAGQTYRCLGCAPRCGRCLETVRALIAKAQLKNCHAGCAICPGHRHDAPPEEQPFLIAAE